MNRYSLSPSAITLAAAALLLAACASSRSKPDLPYPAFVDSAEIEEQFLAALPGVRAREFASDMRTRRISSRVDIPPDWTGTTGGEPGKALEVYVLSGELTFSDFALGPGGYAYVPPGSMGFKLVSDAGAQVLYFLDELDEQAVIRSPVILDSSLVPWEEVRPGIYERELRHDPGSGARSWLMRIEPGATIPWEASSVEREGYAVAGAYRHSECAKGEPATWDYTAGGYFRRPAGAVSGGPEAGATTTTTWFLREQEEGEVSVVPACTMPTEPETAE
jgi:quercetin dioxygenase-like cupin family protein